jgi:hypothetical protein
MNSRNPVILVLIAAALVWALKVAGLFGIFFVAILGTVVTVGLRTGSLAPFDTTTTRTATPVRFWLIIGFCVAGVVANVLNLILRP